MKNISYLEPSYIYIIRHAGMNNRECIDQVERGYRMAQPSHISFPESKTHAKELAVAQANVYKVTDHTIYIYRI